MKTKFFWALGLVAIAFLSRVFPHPANLSPVLAISLIAGRTLSWPVGLAVTLISMILSDLFLGFHDVQFFVYLALLASMLIGFYTRGKNHPVTLATAAISGSSLFFVVSNFGHWYSTTMYSKDVVGLIHCYVMALPFFWRSLAADFLFFGIFLLISKVLLSSHRTNHAFR